MPCASPNSDPAAASELSKKLDSWARRPLGTGRSTGLRLGGGGRRGPEGEAGPGGWGPRPAPPPTSCLAYRSPTALECLLLPILQVGN